MLNDDILKMIPCGVMVLDEKRRILYANKRILDLTGMSLDFIMGKTPAVIGLEPGEKDDSVPANMEWWDWVADSPMHLRTYIRDADNNKIQVFVSSKREKTLSGETKDYICLLATSHIENWAVSNTPDVTTRDHFYNIIGKAPQMEKLYGLIEMASSTGVNVVIQGESGTGKELVASAIHNASPRNNLPFVRVNCAALAETLLESELFGHVKGAFTGAYRDRIGTFESADKGTIFLDEIGEISPAMQAKLLRVLQERVIVRVGDNREIPVDVRIIAATNKNLRNLVSKGLFREDLFYRLNVFPIHVPSLNERKSDLPLLCSSFLKKYKKITGKNIESISPDAMRLLFSYCWPGNVRELENAIEHSFVLCTGNEIQISDLPHDLRVTTVREGICADKIDGIEQVFNPILAQPKKSGGRLNITKDQLVAILKSHNGNKSATARTLGISTVALWRKMKKMGLS